MKKVLLTMLVIALTQISYCQNYKFGKVSVEELEEEFYPLDSTANAAYLYKKRRTYTKLLGSDIQLVTEIQVRLKLYNQEGFDWATEEVLLYGKNNSESEHASGFKAVTYNIVNGKIVETKLNKSNVFTEEQSDYIKVKKFTMPNVKEGSIVEWTYKIYSPFFHIIDDVVVQYEIPVKKYETKIELLEWFNFNKRQRGYYPFKINEYSKRNVDFDTTDKVVAVEVENVPALIEEPFVNNMYNYTAKVQFEVASLAALELGLYENYATSWELIAKNIYKSSSFGGELKNNGHLKDDLVVMSGDLTTTSAKIFGSLNFVKNKIKWNGNLGEYPENGLRKAYKEGSGNIGDINLTLVVVLRELGINANPVLVSTRSNGVPIYPTTKGINYVIVAAETSQGLVLLDASEKYSLPNLLPLRAINWRGTLIRKDGTVDFVGLGSSIVSLNENSLNYKIADDGFIEGINRVKLENMASINYRNKYESIAEDDQISNIEESNDDIEILNFRVSNKLKITKPIVEMYTFEKEDGVEFIGDKMYLTPMLFTANDENPFKLERREYPIDFGTPWQQKTLATIQIPEGYVIESVPENMAIGLRDEMGKFIFSIKTEGNKIQLSSLLNIDSGIVAANYYVELKEFFKHVVAKQTEKIVLSRE